MLTPAQLREYEFKGAGRNAYKADEVDEYLATVAIDYEKMFRENAELIKRVGLLADRLDQMKKEEGNIKQAVLSAQKAADMIVKEAEESVTDAHSEAEAILAAAKGEAQIIKSDAEKQAVADSELLISSAKDKAAEIITKAKDEARTILIDAKDSAKDKVGAANRTVTSESIYFDMLKKEVSDFRSNILAQYKAHIEMISKLPELADEKAKDMPEQPYVQDVILDEPEVKPDADSILEFVDVPAEDEDLTVTTVFDDVEDEPVVKTTLPFDFFGEDPGLEIVNEAAEESELTDEKKFGGFSVDFSDINLKADDFDIDFSDDAQEESDDDIVEIAPAEEETAPVEVTQQNDVPEYDGNSQDDESSDESDFADDNDPSDIPISASVKLNIEADGLITDEEGNSDNTADNSEEDDDRLSFESFEKVDDNIVDDYDDEDDDDDDDDDIPGKSLFGFFHKKK